jgi:trehalose/maltose hydrolase-like predicted phosphorylase
MSSRQNAPSSFRFRAAIFVCALLLAGSVTSLLQSEAVKAQTSSEPSAHSDDAGWTLSTTRFDNSFEAEAFVGNGLLGLRVPAAGMGYLGGLDKVGWPIGTERIASAIAAGVYAKVADGTFYKEQKQAIALIPNWSTLTFADASGVYSAATVSASNVANYRQSLDLRTGTVTTSGIWTSPAGNKARFVYRVVADRAHGHRALVTLDLTAENAGVMKVDSLLDGAAARRLDLVSAAFDRITRVVHATYATKGTDIQVAEAARVASTCPETGTPASNAGAGLAGEQLIIAMQAGQTCTFTKYVAVVTGRESKTPEVDAIAEAQQAWRAGAEALEKENRAAWDAVWSAGIDVDGDPGLQQAIRANEYTLFASIAENSPDSLGPSGLTSDGYAGMIFWDADTWMFPALLAEHPALAKVMVDYRSDTLPDAKKNAANNGYKGALYPWTSALHGDMGDECYGAVTDAHGKVTADPNKSCTQQLHLQADVALAQWEYYKATGDKVWLAERGWPVMQAVAEFYESKVTPVAGGYAIDNIQTPDEYATDTDNDAFTNADASLALHAAVEAAALLGKPAVPAWSKIADGLIKTMTIDAKLSPGHNIYVEHQGYTGQKIKQADVVMLTYPLDFAMPKAVAIDDLNYYTPRTDVDGPAMTDAIHSIAAATVDAPGCSAFTYMERSYQPFLRAPYQQFSEFAPVKLTATAYDFLTGVGGFMQEFLFGFSGFRPLTDAVKLDPNLPPQLSGLKLTRMQWQGRTFTVQIAPKTTTVTLESGASMPLATPDGRKTVEPGETVTIPTRRSDLQPTDNLARCKPVTASSSQPGSPAVAAVDGIPATAWVAADAKAMLIVDLEKPTEIASVRVVRGSREPSPYSVEISIDGTHWKSVANAPATAPGSGAGTDELAFAPVEAREVRLVFAGATGAKPPTIAEIAVMNRAK